MRSSPSIVPHDDDRETYLVLDDFGGGIGLAWRETEASETSLETMIRDLLDGQYADPVRIVCFNTAEGWSRDVSHDVAEELRLRCDLEGRDVPECIRDFVERLESRKRLREQTTLPKPI